MLNLKFILSPGSCGYFCLRYITRKKVSKDCYMSIYKIKEILNNHGYYCSCLKIYRIDDVYSECLTLIKSGKRENHFIVIKKIDNKFVYFYDPLYIGVRKKRKENFVKKWLRICLIYTKV